MSQPAPILNLKAAVFKTDRASAAGAAGAAFLQLLLGLLRQAQPGEGSPLASRIASGSAAFPLPLRDAEAQGEGSARGKQMVPAAPHAAIPQPAVTGEARVGAVLAEGAQSPAARNASGGKRAPSWLKVPDASSTQPHSRIASPDPGSARAPQPPRAHSPSASSAAGGAGARLVSGMEPAPLAAQSGMAAPAPLAEPMDTSTVLERSTSIPQRPGPSGSSAAGPTRPATSKLPSGPEAGASPLALQGPGSEGPPPAREMVLQTGASPAVEPGWRPPVVESEAIRFDVAARGEMAAARPAPSAAQPTAPAVPSAPQGSGAPLPAATPESLPYLVLRAQRAGVERMLVQLVPPALGLIEIGIERRADGSLSAVVRSPRKETLDRIRGEAGAFVRIFAEQGITLRSEDLRFDLMDEGDGGERARPDGGAGARGRSDAPFAAQLMRALVDLSI